MHDNDNDSLTFISMFSGIEAASVAFGPLGWRALCFAEIDKAASALLAYRYPDVPNVGDMSKHNWAQYRGKVDIVCGGPPCQAFSVAGLREGLNDNRGNLSLEYMRALHAIKPRNAIVENVPGWLTMPDNAFGFFLAGLVGADGPFIPVERKPRDGKSSRWWRWVAKEKCHAPRWPKYGMVSGPKGRAAWAVKDAQFFGLAQRRERVLVVADFGTGADPAKVLLIEHGVSRNPPSRGEAREGVAAYFASSLGGYRDANVSGPVRAAGGDSGGGSENIVATLTATYGEQSGQDFLAAGMLQVTCAPETARCVATREGSSQDYESTTMVAQVYSLMPQNSDKDFKARPVDVAQPPLAAGPSHGNQGGDVVCVTGATTHALTAEGHDASEDGSGRGAPIIAFDPRATDVPVTGDITGVLDASYPGPAICFTAKDYGGDAAVRNRANLACWNAQQKPSEWWRHTGSNDATALRASSGGGDKPHVLTSAVRRLTPRECERLMGFQWQCSPNYPGAWQDEAGRWWSPDYTRIPVRKFGKPKVTRLRPADMWECINGEWWLMTADGPRYKQLGNSWAVPKFRWLGKRIAMHMPPLAAKTADNDNQPLSKAT